MLIIKKEDVKIQQEERKRMSNNTPDVEIQQEERKNNPPTHHNA
jgi:hypothetical protein